MIPLRDENPAYSPPIVTVLLIAANVVVFLFQLRLGIDISTVAFGLIPAELVHNADLVYAGRRFGLPPGIGVKNIDPSWITVATSMFMHGSWIHILSNMWYLWIFGNNVEDMMGKGKFLLFYVLCGLAAAASQVILGPGSTVPMVGASGAIAGVLGAYLVLFPGSQVLCIIPLGFIWFTRELPAFIVLGFWFLIQVVSGLGALGMRQAGGVAYAAHVGGFVVGWLLVRTFTSARKPGRRQVKRDADYVDWR